MAAFTPDLSQLKEVYDQFGADLFALCYLQAGRPVFAQNLMVTALCDMAASPRLWELAVSGREGFLRVAHLNCVDASLRRPKRVKRKKGEEGARSPGTKLPFSMTDPLRKVMKLRISPRTALFCRERLYLSPQVGARLMGTSPARFQGLAEAGLKQAGVTSGQVRANLEMLAPGQELLEAVWEEFLAQQRQGGFALRQRFRRVRRTMDTAMPFLALCVVAVCAAASSGVAHACLGRRLGHGRSVRFHLRQGKAFFQDEGAGHIQGLRAHAGQVVDGAADAELADVAAGKLRRRHDEAVRRKSQVRAADGQEGRVVGRKFRIRKMSFKYGID